MHEDDERAGAATIDRDTRRTGDIVSFPFRHGLAPFFGDSGDMRLIVGRSSPALQALIAMPDAICRRAPSRTRLTYICDFCHLERRLPKSRHQRGAIFSLPSKALFCHSTRGTASLRLAAHLYLAAPRRLGRPLADSFARDLILNRAPRALCARRRLLSSLRLRLR